ncbi:MAG: biopolymer transport protein ExbD [Kiritimatiellia bacterium]|jgi:biopolymer transport protein ExbD
MKLKRAQLLIEPPHSAMSDIAFILIVFFLVCASVQPDRGRSQIIPKSEEKDDKKEQSENVEVKLSRTTAFVNGEPVPSESFLRKMQSLLAEKKKESDRVVVVKSKGDTPYHHWIYITGMIEQAGGIITLQLEEEREVMTN